MPPKNKARSKPKEDDDDSGNSSVKLKGGTAVKVRYAVHVVWLEDDVDVWMTLQYLQSFPLRRLSKLTALYKILNDSHILTEKLSKCEEVRR